MIHKVWPHITSMLSGPSGRISSSRCLMIAVSVYAMVILAIVLRHLLGIRDPQLLASWTSILQVLGCVLAAICGLPYNGSK